MAFKIPTVLLERCDVSCRLEELHIQHVCTREFLVRCLFTGTEGRSWNHNNEVQFA